MGKRQRVALVHTNVNGAMATAHHVNIQEATQPTTTYLLADYPNCNVLLESRQ